MTQPRKSITQLAQLNATLLAQNDTLTRTAQVAEQTLNTQGHIQGELYRQRGVLEDNVDKTKQIKAEIKKANKKTNQMRRRNFCIKAGLYLLIIILFAVNIALIVWKAV